MICCKYYLSAVRCYKKSRGTLTWIIQLKIVYLIIWQNTIPLKNAHLIYRSVTMIILNIKKSAWHTKRKYNRKYDRKYKWDGQHKRNWTCRKYTSEEMRLMYERADHVARNYRRIDAQKGFDVSETITGDWIVENIFYKECLYCGCRDYTVLGADRIDNRKPHSANNVVPCCKDCNNKRHTKDFMEFFGMSFMENFILED